MWPVGFVTDVPGTYRGAAVQSLHPADLTLVFNRGTLRIMSTQQLVDELLSLPLRDRVDVAQAVWQSINDASALQESEEERDAIVQARRRDEELTSGAASGRTHEAVMDSVRRSLGCE